MKTTRNVLVVTVAMLGLSSCLPHSTKEKEVDNLSGIYPRLAFYNDEGECGTGAVVPWNGSLWAITYGPHLPFGSSDKLYQISPDMQLTVREESVGGTHANRMIHRESNQLFIGPYVIDSVGNVRTISPKVMPGRLTGNARHLTDPSNKIYYATMEEGLYEVNVHDLSVKEIYKDANLKAGNGTYAPNGTLLPGVHGKGAYSGQGVLVFSNNGEGSNEALVNPDIEAGVLAEWDGKDWKVVRRNQFTEVTGPGGIYGNAHPETDPIWALGWDSKSVLLGVRDVKKGWSFYRLPKSSHSYDGAHGWNTEWPRIRNVGTEEAPEYLMTMHGMFWHFPGSFTADNTAGIRPRSAYLKVIGDFARWNNRLVFGCDDSAKREFLNSRKAKGKAVGPGQSNSNLWFTSVDKPDELGASTADGAVWEDDTLYAGECSDPFLFSGWSSRCCWIENKGKSLVRFAFETDEKGNNVWTWLKDVAVPAGESRCLTFPAEEQGEWIRVKVDGGTVATVSFNYAGVNDRKKNKTLFDGIAAVNSDNYMGGLLYSLGNNRRRLGVLAQAFTKGKAETVGYYELTDSLKLIRKEDKETADFIADKFEIPQDAVTVEKGSVLIVDGKGRQWRLPLGNRIFIGKTGEFRICREVVTERDLFNCLGTFYELPAENAGGYARIRPISSHSFAVHDYASFRGLFVMTGISPEQGWNNEHVIVSDDGKAGVWAGCIDDLWELGKPVGQGGPWLETDVKAQTYSDPYLIGFYDKRTLVLSHNGRQTVKFSMEIDPSGNGDFMKYCDFNVKPESKMTFVFPDDVHGRWVRFKTDVDVNATAWLVYE